MKFISRLLLTTGILLILGAAGASDNNTITLHQTIAKIFDGALFLIASYITEFIRIAAK